MITAPWMRLAHCWHSWWWYSGLMELMERECYDIPPAVPLAIMVPLQRLLRDVNSLYRVRSCFIMMCSCILLFLQWAYIYVNEFHVIKMTTTQHPIAALYSFKSRCHDTIRVSGSWKKWKHNDEKRAAAANSRHSRQQQQRSNCMKNNCTMRNLSMKSRPSPPVYSSLLSRCFYLLVLEL